jgi:hypothetical protein
MPLQFNRLPEPVTVLNKEEKEYVNQLLRVLRNNFSDIETLERSINAPVYEDLRFPATAINPPGVASDPDFDNVNGGFLFSATSTELLFVGAQLPHSWKEGSDIEPHVHWQKTTSDTGDVYWQIEYKWAPIGGIMDASFTQAGSYTTVITDDNTADKHLITSLGSISTTGRQISDMLLIRIAREGGNVNDTYGADARLLEFDIHIELDSRGSQSPYAK